MKNSKKYTDVLCSNLRNALRNMFSNATNTGIRSVSGRTITGNYVKVVLIYGTTPSVEPLLCGPASTLNTYDTDGTTDDASMFLRYHTLIKYQTSDTTFFCVLIDEKLS